VHEMLHPNDPTCSDRFLDLMDERYAASRQD
jgi:hypothetical protein